MSRAGLTFSSSMFSDPEAAYAATTQANPAAPVGARALGVTPDDIAVMGQQALSQTGMALLPPPEQTMQPSQPQIFYDVQGQRLSVNGLIVDANDYTGIAQTVDALKEAPRPVQEPGDWRPISLADYQAIVSGIMEPSRGRLFTQNFASGVSSLKEIGGAALQLAGFEETGAAIMDRAEAEMARREVFTRDVTEIEGAGDAIDWFVSVLGQQGPIILESAAAALAGGVVGSKLAGPGVGTAGGAIAGVFGRKEFKARVLEAAKKAREQGKDKLTPTEVALLRSAGSVVGATAATVANNYAIGAGDIYGEMLDQDSADRLVALAGAIPYAALSSASDFIAASKVLGLANRAPLPVGATRGQRGTEYLKRFGGGAAVVGTTEGLTEAAQEALVLGLSGQDLGSDESVNRLINALAAGAAVGGTIGGVGALRSGDPVNIAKPGDSADLSDVNTPTPDVPPAATQTSRGLEEQDLLQPSGALPAPPIDQLRTVRGEIPAGTLGPQGVLDLGGIPQAEARLRAQPAQAPAEAIPMPAPTPEVDPRQSALQFGQPAPQEGSFGREVQQAPPNQLQQALIRIQQQRAQQQRDQQVTEQTAQQRETGLDRMVVDQRVADLEQRLAQSTQAEVVPAREAITPTSEPTQLPLFRPRETPRPTRAERLRAGVRPVEPLTDDRMISDAVPDEQMDLPGIAPVVTEERAKLAWDERRPNNIKRWENLTDDQKARWSAFVGAGQATPLARKNVSAVREGMDLPDVTPTVETVDAAPQPTQTAEKKAAPKAAKLKKPVRAKAKSTEPVATRSARTTPPQMTQAEVEAAPVATRAARPTAQEAQSTAQQEADAAAARTIETVEAIEARLANLDDDISVSELALVVEESGNSDRIQEAIFSLIGLAMDSSNNAENRQAREVLLEQSSENMVLVEEFTTELKSQAPNSIDALITKGQNKGTERFAYEMAKKLGVANRFIDRFKNVPARDMAVFRPDAPEGATQVGSTTAAVIDNPAKALADEIKRLDNLGNIRTNKQAANDKQKLEAMYAALTEEQRDYGTEKVMGTDTVARVRDFFTEDGELKQHPTSRKPTFTDTTREDVQQDRVLTEQGQAIEDNLDVYISESTLDSWNDLPYDDRGSMLDDDSPWGRFRRLDDGSPIKPVAIGRVRLLVRNFVAKLGVKPKVHVFKNQQDMAQRNPQLYERASASRPQGDFDSAAAVGFSFGDGQVIIFSDRVATEQQLQFVLAHETLGHFGFRGLVSESQLNTILDKIYEENQDIRQAVDMAVEARGMTRREATEEYLADTAAMLETNILARFWNAIKNALNKLGVKFDDDIARYMVNQSRAYVRHGVRAGNFFDNAKVAQTMYDVEHREGDYAPGRFATTEGSVRRTNEVAGIAAQMGRETLDSASDYMKKIKAKGVNVRDVAERLLNDLTTMTFLANENRGYNALYEAMRSMTQRAHSLRNNFNNSLRELLEPSVTVMGTKLGRGMSKEQVSQTVNMANISSIVRASQINETKLRAMPDIIDFIDGKPVVNEDVVNDLKKQGRISLEEFRDGFEYEVTEVQALDDEGRQILEARLEAALKEAKTDQERDAAQAEYDTDIADDVYTVKTKRKFEGIPGLTEDSPEWKGYLAIRDTMDRAAINLLEANYANARAERVDLYEVASASIGRDLTDSDRAFLNRAADRFITLRHEGATVNEDGMFTANQDAIDRAQAFIAKLNEALLSNESDKHPDAAAFFDAAEQQSFLDDIAAFKTDSNYNTKKGQARFEIQRALQNITMFDMSRADAQLYAKQSIAGSYVPLGREGRFQIRVQAIDPTTGQSYVVSERFKNQMVYMMTDGQGTADLISDDINKVLRGDGETARTFQVEVVVDGETVVRDVNLVARSEVATIGGFEGGVVNLNEVAHTLVRFGINLTPAERERLIVGLTEQNASARKRLRREGTPGYETGTMKYISRHLESIASTIARKEYRPYIDRLFVKSPRSNELWFGSQEGYDSAKAKYEALRNDPTANPEAVKLAQREFDRYHLSFVTKKSQTRGNDYQNQAQRLLSFMESQRSVEFTDFSSGELGSQLRFWTVIAQLGGSFATGMLNIIALQTNVVPYLASYSSKRAFGGGFGLARSQTALLKAMKDVGLPKYSDLQTWKDIVADPEQVKAMGLTQQEARFMLEEVSDGTFQAAQTNSMLGNARGLVTNAAGQKLTRVWMYFFNESEQAARRGTGLSAFRLAYDRSMQALESRTDLTAQERQDLAYAEARSFAIEAVDRTVGEYAMFNRPAMFRGDIRQFMFMYMMFPLTSVLLMRNLNRKGQLLMIGTLLFLSGVKGLPFAEDLMDMVDTIAQMLGLGPSKLWRGSAERTLAEAIDEIAPGVTPTIMRGFVNQFIGINLADRTSLGNIVPGTGIALAGSNTANELMEIFGPVAGFVDGLVGTAKSTANYMAQTAGIAAGDTSFASLVRNGPFTMGRALGDMMVYHDTGAIVGLNGYVISRDLTPVTYIGRALGFYPAAAVSENDVVRISRRVNDYTAEVAAMYRGMYISARLSNDPSRAQEVVQQVNAWNEAARGSGMEIRNFVVNANRALREAERTTTDRYIRTTPRASRDFAEDMLRIYGLND